MHREYAEASGGEWVILSAKYGFLRPTDLIPGPSEVTFKSPSTGPIALDALRGVALFSAMCGAVAAAGSGVIAAIIWYIHH